MFQAWKAVQALVGKTGKESLKRRCLECDPSKIINSDIYIYKHVVINVSGLEGSTSSG